MQTTAMVGVCRAVTLTDTGAEQVCSRSRPESVTVMMSGERPVTWYRPGGSQAENLPEAPTPTETGRCPGAVKVTVPGIGRSAGCCPCALTGPRNPGSEADRDLGALVVALRDGRDGDRLARRDAPGAPGHGGRVEDVADEGRGSPGRDLDAALGQ
jgi:hypothetical protein